MGLTDDVRAACARSPPAPGRSASTTSGWRPTTPGARGAPIDRPRARPGAPLPRGLRRGRRHVPARARHHQLRLGLVPDAAQARRPDDRPDRVGVLHRRLEPGRPLPRARAVDDRRPARDDARRRSPRSSARPPTTSCMALYAQALRDLGRFLGDARARSTSSRRPAARPSGWPRCWPAGMALYDDRGFYKRAQIVPNDLQLGGVAPLRRPRPADDLRRQPGPPRAALRRRARLRPGAGRAHRRRARAARRAAPSARSARARSTPCELLAAAPRRPAARAGHVAVEPRPGARAQGARRGHRCRTVYY